VSQLIKPAIKQNMTTPDGATIGYQTVGCGPPVIVIPGVLSMAAKGPQKINRYT